MFPAELNPCDPPVSTSSSSSCARSRCGSQVPHAGRCLRKAVSHVFYAGLHEPSASEHQFTSEDVLPANLTVATLKDVLVHLAASPKHCRSPLSSTRNLEFHTPSYWLSDTELSSQHLHLQPVLRVTPLCEASLERVSGLKSDRRRRAV